MKNIILFLIFSIASKCVFAQCTETNKFPTLIVNAPNYKDSLLVSSSNYAGDYFEVTDFESGKSYTFSSSASPADYITLTDKNNNLITHGQSPLTIILNPSSPEVIFRVHISLVSPPCGNQTIKRIIWITCNNCVEAANVGIGTNKPANSAKLDISSISQGLKIPVMTQSQRDAIDDPVEGLIVYNSTKKNISSFNGNRWNQVSISIPPSAFYNQFGAEDYITWFEIIGAPYKYEFRAPLQIPYGSTLKTIEFRYLDNHEDCQVRFGVTEYNYPTRPRNLFVYESFGSETNPRSYIFDNVNTTILPPKMYNIFTSFTENHSNCAFLGAIVTYEY
jgi:hypothetical protein